MANQTRQHSRGISLHSTNSLTKLSTMLVWILSLEGALGFASLRTTDTKGCAASLSSSTLLQYRSSNDELETLSPGKSRGGWWSPFLSSTERSSTKEDTTRAVDDYLEFLERRYHRLHDSDHTPPSSDVKFSAWKWLKHEDEDAITPETQQRQQEDALYVLGVAGLASQKLLQKHHGGPALLTSTPRATVSPIIETSAQTSEEDSLIPTVASTLLIKITPLMRQIALRRKLFLRYQARQLNEMAALLTKVVASAPAKAANAVWRMGGGKKNIGVTLTVMAAITFFLLRPLSEVLMSVRSA